MRTYFKLDKDWLEIFKDIDNRIREGEREILTNMAEEYADEVVPIEASADEFEFSIHFFTATFILWKENPNENRIKIKTINKLASSMMNAVTEITENPDKKKQLQEFNNRNALKKLINH